MDFWEDLLSNIIAVIIGAIFALLIGFRILRYEQNVNKIENGNRYVKSLLKELEQHSKHLEDYLTNILHIMGPGSEHIRYYSTVAFESGASAGLFSYLSEEAQDMLSSHYTKIDIINDLLKVHASEYLKDQIQSKYRLDELIRHQSTVKDTIDELIEKIESEIKKRPSFWDC